MPEFSIFHGHKIPAEILTKFEHKTWKSEHNWTLKPAEIWTKFELKNNTRLNTKTCTKHHKNLQKSAPKLNTKNCSKRHKNLQKFRYLTQLNTLKLCRNFEHSWTLKLQKSEHNCTLKSCRNLQTIAHWSIAANQPYLAKEKESNAIANHIKLWKRNTILVACIPKIWLFTCLGWNWILNHSKRSPPTALSPMYTKAPWKQLKKLHKFWKKKLYKNFLACMIESFLRV